MNKLAVLLFKILPLDQRSVLWRRKCLWAAKGLLKLLPPQPLVIEDIVAEGAREPLSNEQENAIKEILKEMTMDQITHTGDIPHLADQATQTEEDAMIVAYRGEDGIYQKTTPIPYIRDKLATELVKRRI